MRDLTHPGVLPLRPLTTGELLDAAVVLVRMRPGVLLGLGFAAALIEQAVLFPLRRWADVDSTFLPADDRLARFGLLMVVGYFTEVLAIVVLAGITSARATRALLGPAVPSRTAPRRGPMLVGAVIAATIACASAWAFLVLPVPLQVAGLVLAFVLTALCWPIGYGLIGLVTPAVVIDGFGPLRALRRSVVLSSRGGLRVLWIRLLGYFVWILIRIGLSLAVIGLVDLVYASPSPTVDNLLMGGVWLLVNAIAYPILGGLDCALHLEARMRTEGLDISLRTSLRRGTAPPGGLTVARP